MRGPNLGLLPRQVRRPAQQDSTRASVRQCAVRYASYGWPVTTGATTPTTDPEKAQALWSMLPSAAVHAVSGEAFDVVEADATPGRAALLRLERLGVPVGPVLWVPTEDRIGFLVQCETLGPVPTLLGESCRLRVLRRGDLVELPGAAHSQTRWLREPATVGIPPELPPAHVVLGGIASCRVPQRH
jgi:hypothetical protein